MPVGNYQGVTLSCRSNSPQQHMMKSLTTNQPNVYPNEVVEVKHIVTTDFHASISDHHVLLREENKEM